MGYPVVFNRLINGLFCKMGYTYSVLGNFWSYGFGLVAKKFVSLVFIYLVVLALVFWPSLVKRESAHSYISSDLAVVLESYS